MKRKKMVSESEEVKRKLREKMVKEGKGESKVGKGEKEKLPDYLFTILFVFFCIFLFLI